MKNLLVIGVLCLSFVFSVLGAATQCFEDQCKIDDNCRCSSTKNPLTDGEAPQLISITIDESVVNSQYNDYYSPLLINRTNPDGNHIGVTFFVPHEYTDYELVKNLYVQGFEIASNSITKNSLQEYWRNATKDTLIQEFDGQRTIISTFANIPAEDIVGARTPQLQIEGDVTFDAYSESNFLYDSSWPTHATQLLFPYTLNYASTQTCTVSNQCPVESHPGFWVLPIINLKGTDNNECNSLLNCVIDGSAEDIGNWLLGEVDRIRGSTKAPLTILLTSAWFLFTENSFEGFTLFLDGLKDRSDVFLVSQIEVLNWIKNPVPLADFKTATYDRVVDCNPVNCELTKPNGDIRYMKSCISCPDVYPWLGNPHGDSNPTTEPPNPTDTTTTGGSTTTPPPTATPTTPIPTATT